MVESALRAMHDDTQHTIDGVDEVLLEDIIKTNETDNEIEMNWNEFRKHIKGLDRERVSELWRLYKDGEYNPENDDRAYCELMKSLPEDETNGDETIADSVTLNEGNAVDSNNSISEITEANYEDEIDEGNDDAYWEYVENLPEAETNDSETQGDSAILNEGNAADSNNPILFRSINLPTQTNVVFLLSTLLVYPTSLTPLEDIINFLKRNIYTKPINSQKINNPA